MHARSDTSLIRSVETGQRCVMVERRVLVSRPRDVVRTSLLSVAGTSSNNDIDAANCDRQNSKKRAHKCDSYTAHERIRHVSPPFPPAASMKTTACRRFLVYLSLRICGMYDANDDSIGHTGSLQSTVQC